MMLYLDTNIIAAYYCSEPMSERVEAFMVSQKEQMAISHLTEVELVSAISRKIREKCLNAQEGKKIINQFENHIKEGYFVRLFMNEKHFKKAKEWILRFDNSLKTLDALHLALSVCENAPLVTMDKQLIDAAQLLHIDTIEMDKLSPQ